MTSARELTRQYVETNNRRERAAMRELLPATLEFVRPGGGTLRTAEEVMAQYERDWATLERSRVDVRNLMASGDAIIAEITVEGSLRGRSAAVEGVIAHRWHDGKFVRYRFCSDSLPKEVAAVQPPRSDA